MRTPLFLLLILASSLFLLVEEAFAGYTPSSKMYLFGTGNSGQNGNISFSYSPTQSWGSPVSPTYFDNSYVLHGNVWLDAVGWMTFDHGVVGADAKVVDTTCVTNDSLSSCPLTGYLWSKNVGWIRFSGNNGQPDVVYDKVAKTLSGFTWNNQVGWINVNGIKAIIGAITVNIPGGVSMGTGNYVMSTTGSTSFSLNIPASVLPILTSTSALTTIKISPSSFPSYSVTYPVNLTTGIATGIDLSMATDYIYEIKDGFGSVTTGSLFVYAGRVVGDGSSALGGTYNLGQGLLKKFCQDNPGNVVYCPDGSSPSTSFVNGDLKNGAVSTPKLADSVEGYAGQLALRDAYGNQVKSVAGVKDVKFRAQFSSTLDYSSIANTYQYGYSLFGAGDAFEVDHNLGSYTPLSLPYGFTGTYVPSGDTLLVKSYAPTTEGNTTIPPSNSLNLSSFVTQVIPLGSYSQVGEGVASITPLFKTTNLPFTPLVTVSSFLGLDDIQVGRLAAFTGVISVNGAQLSLGDTYIIHALTIGAPGSTTTTTFQDFTDTSPTPDCTASVNSVGQVGYNGYCTRGSNILSSPASVIAFPTPGSANNLFTAIPRRLVQVDLAQTVSYDSIVRYKVQGNSNEVIYPSLSLTTASTSEQVFANAVRIIGQKSGNLLFQSISGSTQEKINAQPRIDYINAVRRNIGLLTRNVTYDAQQSYSNPTLKVYKKNHSIDPQAELITGNKQTIVVYGDVTITSDLTAPDGTPPLAIIALKNEYGSGGNVYVESGVQRIDASIIAEGTLFSGQGGATPRYYAQEPTAATTLTKQLYIFGTVISANTIGGASLPVGAKCPVQIDGCSNVNALIYDFEHLRYYRGTPGDEAPLARGSLNLTVEEKKSSLIIEYNQDILNRPPPGLKVE